MQDFEIQRPEPNGRAKPTKPATPAPSQDSVDHRAYYTPPPREDARRAPVRTSDQGPMMVYWLYIASLLLVITSVAGLKLAYDSRESATDVDRSHYTYQIRMFWIGLLLIVVGLIGIPFVVGYFVIIGWGVWFVYAVTRGIVLYRKGRAI